MSQETKKTEAAQGELSVDAKKILKRAAADKRKVKYGERMELEVLKDTKHYKKGQLIAPHTIFAEALIEQKIAKKVEKK